MCFEFLKTDLKLKFLEIENFEMNLKFENFEINKKKLEFYEFEIWN